MIQRHSWQEWVRAIAGLLFLTYWIPVWIWIFRFKKDKNE